MPFRQKLTVCTMLCLSPVISHAVFSANIALVSDYVFRGVSQTLEDPAIQGGFDYNHESGFYAGTWASNVDFVDGGPDDDGADLEVDLYLGFGGDFSDTWNWDVSYTEYLYPGTASGVDLDYGELIVNIGYNEFLTFTLGYSNEVFAIDETGIYYGVSLGDSISDQLSWKAAIGHYDLDDALGDGYTDYSLGLTYEQDRFAIGLTYHGGDQDDLFGDIGDDRLVLSLSSSF